MCTLDFAQLKVLEDIHIWPRWSNKFTLLPETTEKSNQIRETGFQDTGYQATEDSDIWEVENKQGDPYSCPG